MALGASLLLWQCGWSIRHMLSLSFGTTRAQRGEHQPPEGDNNPCGPITRGEDKVPPSLCLSRLCAPQSLPLPRAAPNPAPGEFWGESREIARFHYAALNLHLDSLEKRKQWHFSFLAWGCRKMMAPLMQSGNPSGKVSWVSALKETWRANPSCLSYLFALVKAQSVASTCAHTTTWSIVILIKLLCTLLPQPSTPPLLLNSFLSWPSNPFSVTSKLPYLYTFFYGTPLPSAS